MIIIHTSLSIRLSSTTHRDLLIACVLIASDRIEFSSKTQNFRNFYSKLKSSLVLEVIFLLKFLYCMKCANIQKVGLTY